MTETAVKSVAELLDRLGRTMRRLEFVDGLNPAQWEALRYLARANRFSRTPGALADFLGATRGTISQTLISLEDKGCIRRARSLADRRITILELTAVGEGLLAKDPLRRIDEIAAELPAESGAALQNSLDCLLRTLGLREGLKDFGVCRRCCHFQENGAESLPDPHICGLTGEPLNESETACLCVNYKRLAIGQ